MASRTILKETEKCCFPVMVFPILPALLWQQQEHFAEERIWFLCEYGSLHDDTPCSSWKLSSEPASCGISLPGEPIHQMLYKREGWMSPFQQWGLFGCISSSSLFHEMNKEKRGKRIGMKEHWGAIPGHQKKSFQMYSITHMMIYPEPLCLQLHLQWFHFQEEEGVVQPPHLCILPSTGQHSVL